MRVVERALGKSIIWWRMRQQRQQMRPMIDLSAKEKTNIFLACVTNIFYMDILDVSFPDIWYHMAKAIAAGCYKSQLLSQWYKYKTKKQKYDLRCCNMWRYVLRVMLIFLKLAKQLRIFNFFPKDIHENFSILCRAEFIQLLCLIMTHSHSLPPPKWGAVQKKIGSGGEKKP